MASSTTTVTAGAYLRRAAASSLGAKVLMAVSGLLFYGWLVLHLLGNLAIFAGQETMNEYAHLLQSKPALLWGQRIGLLAVALTHIVTGIILTRRNAAARPQPYQSPRNWRQASLASRTMAISGLVVLSFIIFHLLHFTGGVVLSEFYAKTPVDPSQVPDVYAMVTRSFHTPWVALVYFVGMGFIGLHLSHAVWSATQTLGLNGPKWTPLAKTLGFALGVGLAAVFSLIPAANLADIIKVP